MRFCICFFGLTRSLKITYNSIEKNIFNVLKKNNISYDVYLHTYNLKQLTNKRSKEKNCVLDTNEWKLLKPKQHIIDDQNKFDKIYNYDRIKKNGDAWKDNYCSLINSIRSAFSIYRVTQLWKYKKRYDLYIYLRPDLMYHNPLNINIIKSYMRVPNVILTPYWHKFRGLNDRFAIGNYKTMLTYGERYKYIPSYVEKYGRKYHSERFIKFMMYKFRIRNIDIPIKASRVRANGKIKKEDFSKIN